MGDMRRTSYGPQSALLWRTVVIVGSSATAVAVAAGMAQGLPAAEAPGLAALRGATVAGAAGLALFGTAWVIRRGFVLAGIAADESLLPADAPEPLQSVRRRLARSRPAVVVTGVLVGLLLGLVGAGVDVSSDRTDERVAGAESVQFSHGTPGGELSRGSSARSGTRSESGATGSDTGSPGDGESGAGPSTEGSSSTDGSSGSGGSGGSGGSSGSDGSGGSGDGSPGTTTTTLPLVGYVCEALDDFDGDIDALLGSLGLDEGDITVDSCGEIEDAINLLNDLLGSILPVPITDPADLLDPITDLITEPATTPTTVPLLGVPITLPRLF